MSNLQNADRAAPVQAIAGLTPNQVKRAMVRRFRFEGPQGAPMLLKGPPGVGKTEIGEEAAEELTKEFVRWEAIKAKKENRAPRQATVGFMRISAPQMGPEDIKGIPGINRDVSPPVCIWHKPYFLPTENPERDKHGNIKNPVYLVLLIDELTTATKAVMASLLTLVLDRRVQEYKLPDGVMMVAAGNRLEDKAYTIQLSSALSNRFTHVQFKADMDSWFKWAWKPENSIHDTVIAFLRAKGPADPKIFSGPPEQNKPYPTPRGWKFVSDYMKENFDQDKTGEEYILHQLIKGTVGEGAGQEFITFLNLYDEIPTTEEILKDPKGAMIPKGPDGRWAVVTSLAKAAKENKNHKAIVTYLKRLDAAFAMVGIRDALRENFDIAINGDGDDLGGYMADFIKDHMDVIFYDED